MGVNNGSLSCQVRPTALHLPRSPSFATARARGRCTDRLLPPYRRMIPVHALYLMQLVSGVGKDKLLQQVSDLLPDRIQRRLRERHKDTDQPGTQRDPKTSQPTKPQP